ncbi:hypothetical protein CQA53_07570 [Helicobacter didelphidarum]|uniref:Uncharacterized protein n=2 Tax=Helicobacter didelphidarum TaxID=2040648 RepID=A0A3D8IK21_9HELI|nr:hypothetical protein CQA53_07570 [Helicobacter didelphidarum]
MKPSDDTIIPTQHIDTTIPNISHNLFDYTINPKAFINAHNFSTLDELVDEVKRIDNDHKAYQDMLHEPLFLDNFDPCKYYEKQIFNFLDSILSQDPNEAFRRGNSAMLYLYNYRAQKRDNSAKLRKKIAHFPRNMLRKIKEHLKS